MFENLTDKLQRVFQKTCVGKESSHRSMWTKRWRAFARALLEGDVNVGRGPTSCWSIFARRALGSEVLLQLSPDQQVIKIVRDELALLLGKHAKPQFSSAPARRFWLIVGAPGLRQDDHDRQASRSGSRRTATGRSWFPTDVYRPAAREQLAQVAKAVNVLCWPRRGHRQATRKSRARRDPRSETSPRMT